MHYLFLFSLLVLSLAVSEGFYMFIRKRTLIRGVLVSGLSVIILYILYVFAFVNNDFTLRIVYENTYENMPISLRIAASWASGDSAFLYISFLLACLNVLYIWKKEDATLLSSLINFTLSFMLGLAIFNGIFSETGFKAVSGIGINPLLKSFWMYIHPLLSLLAYALGISIAVGVDAKTSVKTIKTLQRLGWVITTAALLTGGVWSYYTFGWGGYWAWDPVETVQLALWISFTLSLHSSVLGIYSFRMSSYLIGASVLLGLFITRIGVSPLHGFSNPREITGILLLALIFLFLIKGFYNIDSVIKDVRKSFALKQPYSVGGALNFISLFAAYLLFLSSLLIPSIGIILGFNVSPPQLDNAITLYHPILVPLLYIILISLPMCSIGKKVGWKEVFPLLAGASLISIIFVYLTGRRELIWSTHSDLLTNAYISLLMPITVLGISTTSINFIWDILTKDKGKPLDLTSVSHLGMAILVLGVLISGPYSYNDDIMKTRSLNASIEELHPDFNIRIKDYAYYVSDSRVKVVVNDTGSYVNLLSSYAQLLIATQISQIVNITSTGERLAENMGIKWALDRRILDAETENLTYSCIITLQSDSKEPCELKLRDAELFALVSQEGSSLVIRYIIIGKSYIYASERVYDELITTGGLNIEFVPYHLSINTDAIRLAVSKATILTFDLLKHSASRPFYENGVIELSASTLLATEGEVFYGNIKYDVPTYLETPLLTMYYNMMRREDIRSIIELLRETGLYDKFSEGTIFSNITSRLMAECKDLESVNESCLSEFFYYLVVPESAYLDLLVNIEGKDYRVKIRFDVAGEVKGIHGLVPKVVTAKKGLSDIYIVFRPPLYYDERYGDSAVFHDLMVYYISSLKNVLSEEDLLRLIVTLVSGYYSGVQDVTPADIATQSLILYAYAMNYTPAIIKDGVLISYKYIPDVGLIWIGGGIMIVGALSVTVYNVLMARRRRLYTHD